MFFVQWTKLFSDTTFIVDSTAGFIEMVQMFTDKTVSSLKAIPPVVCSVDVESLKFWKRLCRVLIECGLTLLSLLLVATSVTITDAEEFRCCIEPVIHLYIQSFAAFS